MKFLTFLASLILIQAVAFAQTSDTAVKNDGATPQTPQIDLLLNGIILDKELFEYRLQTAVHNGQEDSLELRLAIRDELYNRALLLEEAKTTGISKNKAVKLLVQETQENVYIDLLFQEYLKTHPITDTLLKTEYDRQLKELSPNGLLIEYHLGTIVVADEQLAKDIIQKTKTMSFAQLAKEYSIDTSANRGGDLGWINIVQLSPTLRSSLPQSPHQQILKTPLQIGKNWHIIKIFDRREGKPGTFTESKERLKPAVTQRLRQEYIEELRQKRVQARSNK